MTNAYYHVVFYLMLCFFNSSWALRVYPQDTTLKSNTLPTEPNILFGILSDGQNKHKMRLDAQMSTWMTNLKPEEIMIVGTPALQGMESRAQWRDTPTCGHDHASGSCKEMALLQIAHNMSKKLDWLFILGDDHYVIPKSVKNAVQEYDPNNPLNLGIEGCTNGQCSGMCGGGGQLLSRRALEQMFEKGDVSFSTEYSELIPKCSSYGDLTTSTVATHHGVKLKSIRGVYGWPTDTTKISTLLEQDTLPLLFHYVPPSEMYEIHSLVTQKTFTKHSLLVQMREVYENQLTSKSDAWNEVYDAQVAKYIKDVNSRVYSKTP